MPAFLQMAELLQQNGGRRGTDQGPDHQARGTLPRVGTIDQAIERRIQGEPALQALPWQGIRQQEQKRRGFAGGPTLRIGHGCRA
jgi:hypothetical protein